MQKVVSHYPSIKGNGIIIGLLYHNLDFRCIKERFLNYKIWSNHIFLP